MWPGEKADELAKLATTKRPPATFRTSISYLKRVARAKMVSEWKEWRDSTLQKGTQYFGPFRTKPNIIFRTNNRALIPTVTQLRTGHGYFNSYVPIQDPHQQHHFRPMQLPRQPAANASTSDTLVPSTPLSTTTGEGAHPKNPRLRLQLLLYTNMGADVLGSYLTTTRVATRRWKLGLDQQQTTQEARRPKRMIWW